jgi:hypothetical protein
MVVCCPGVLLVSLCGPVYAPFYPLVLCRCHCVLRVSMWSRLCAGVSHSYGPLSLVLLVCYDWFVSEEFHTVGIAQVDRVCW